MSSMASYMQANTTQDHDPRFEGHAVESNNPNSTAENKKFRLRISQRLHWTAVLAFISYLILLVSFASPYWLSSYKFVYSSFKRLGLWDVCFLDYRHPSYQYDQKFTGCHWIFSPYYTNIRDWLQPPWFIFVQTVMTIALCIDTLGLVAASIIFMHYLIQYQLLVLLVVMICHMFTTMLLFFALIIFYFKAFQTGWVEQPKIVYLDWAYFFALVSLGCNAFASVLYYKEVKLLKERMLKMKRLIVATPNGRSLTGGDIDSLDAVYAARSVNLYNQERGRTPQSNKDAGLTYPHFTQV